MMTELASSVISILGGKTLATAESCTGGGIGQVLTAVPGSSVVFKGGIISYCNQVKAELLGVPKDILAEKGAVSAPVAEAMARGAMESLKADIAVSVTGLAGPGGDDFGNPVGTVFAGYCDKNCSVAVEYHFEGDRESVRHQAIEAVLQLILEHNR